MRYFDKADYDDGASCRIRVDYMISACKLSYLGTFAASDTDRQSTILPLEVSSANPNRPLPLIVYTEMDQSVEIEDQKRADIEGGCVRRLRITGKANWAFGYDGWKGSGVGTVLIAIGAKNPTMFSQARNQLLTYLGIMKKLRHQENKTNEHVQGFYSDGCRYISASLVTVTTCYGIAFERT